MVAFIILHYGNISDTLECLNSIKKLERDKKIIVVDNHSLDKKGKDVLKKMCDDLLCLKTNLGFAKANNYGCDLAIKKYKPAFLVVINNDTVINQKDFLLKINKINKRTSFDILGPKIISKEGSGSVNPYFPLKNISEVEKELKYQQKLLNIYHYAPLYWLLQSYLKIKHFFKKPAIPQNGTKELENVCLHGCALIFSEKYYKKYENIFYDQTFLFHEEDFLYQRIINDHLISIYSPEIEIIHKEGASLNLKFSTKTREKLIFRTSEIIKSLQLLKGEMEL